MPVINSKDSAGPYYKWGESGKKYHYIPGNKQSRNIAKRRALAQGRAIHARRGY